MKTKYFNYSVLANIEGAAIHFDVVACDMQSAHADIMQANPTAKIIQTCQHDI